MSNPVNEERELARMLVDSIDRIVENFHGNIDDVVGNASDVGTIDSTELMHNVNHINALRNLRADIVAGATGALFTRHNEAMKLVIEMTLDMES